MAGESDLKLTISEYDKLERAIAALGVAKEQIPEHAQAEIMAQAKDLATAAALRALSLTTHGTKHTGLRERVAAGVSAVPTETGATIQTAMDREDEAIIPRGLDTIASGGNGWNHPFFGNRDHWFRNYPTRSWFLTTMYNGYESAQGRLEAMLEQVAEGVSSSIG